MTLEYIERIENAHLAPDHPNLRPPNLLLCTVHESDLLASVESSTRLALFGGVDSTTTHIAAFVSSTPSILMRLVPGLDSIRQYFNPPEPTGVSLRRVSLSSLVAKVLAPVKPIVSASCTKPI